MLVSDEGNDAIRMYSRCIVRMTTPDVIWCSMYDRAALGWNRAAHVPRRFTVVCMVGVVPVTMLPEFTPNSSVALWVSNPVVHMRAMPPPPPVAHNHQVKIDLRSGHASELVAIPAASIWTVMSVPSGVTLKSWIVSGITVESVPVVVSGS